MPPRGGTRMRLESPDSRPTKRIRVQSPPARPSQNNAMPASEKLTYPQTVELCDKLSSFARAERYKEWRGNGSIHDSYCRVCHLPGRLERCETCNISFHSFCIPRGWIRDSSNRWFCPICVRNEWHISPPKDTRPFSPEPETVRDPTGIPLIASIECESRDPPLSSPSGGSFTSYANECAPRSSPAQPERGLIPLNQRSAIHEGGPGSRYHPQNVDIFDRPQEPAGPTRRHRKSRSSTLDDDVDASLGVIYRKLESIPALKEQIDRLESLNAKQRRNNDMAYQVIELQKDRLDRMRNSQQPSQVTERLQASNAKLEEANAELKGLREQRDALQAELQVSRDEARNATEMMNEWKGKLAQLINP